MARAGLGRDFAWLWRAYAVSALGTWLALDAFSLVAIFALHASAAQVSLIAAVSGAAAALLAVPLGPWVEFRRKRPLMVHADIVRFAALLTVPLAHFAGVLSYPHLLVVAVVVALAGIVFTAASGAHLKSLVPAEHLLTANGRFENVSWITTAVGPPLGGVLVGVLGPVITMALDAASYLLSALGLRAIRAPEPAPPARAPGGRWLADLGEGWRVIAGDRVLRLLFANTVLVGALIMATSPLLAYLMLQELGFTPVEYGLAFGVPCLGGIIGARAARPLVRRFGQERVLLTAGVARVVWFTAISLVGSGLAGLLLVIAVEAATITCMGVFIPVFATVRLQRTADDKIARVLTAWTVTSRSVTAVATALWGVLAHLTSARTAVAVAGALLLATAPLLPWRTPVSREPAVRA